MYSQVDLEGRHQLIFCETNDHRKNDDVIPIAQGTVKTDGGQSLQVIMTKGWELKVVWADGMASWLPSKIDDEPTFKWWVSTTLKKQQVIVAKARSRYWRSTHKFGVKPPHSVEEAYKIDEQNGNNYW